MNKKDKSIKDDNDVLSKESLNGNEKDLEDNKVVKGEAEENIETPTYEELFDQNEELEKSLLRANADLDNALKRTFSEVEKAHKYGIEKLLIELLPIIDNLESAISNLSENATKEDREGIELTLKSFESTLDKFGLVPIYPDNEEFNPEKHEAVSMEEDDKKKDGYIGKVFQRGWELHSRILRPARVTVIKN